MVVHWWYPVAIGLLVLALLAPGASSDAARRVGLRRLGRSVLVGLIATAAGYVPYLVSISHVEVTQRTFLSVAPGAALFVVGMLGLLAKATRVPVVLLALVPITLGTTAQAFQHDRYARAYIDYIRPYLDLAASRADTSKRVHLIQDTSGVATYLNGAYFTKLRDGLPLMLRSPNDVFVLCREQPFSSIAFFAHCTREGDLWSVSTLNGPTFTYPAAETDVISIGTEVLSDVGPSGHWRHLGRFKSTDSLFEPQAEPGNTYDCVADSMWGYAGFCPGIGWSDGVPVRSGPSTRAHFRSVAPEATLVFHLNPDPMAYTLRVAFATTPQLMTSLLVNGRAVELRWTAPLLLEAHVPADTLHKGLNEIRFLDVLPQGAAVGIAVERVVLAPEGSGRLPQGPPPPKLDVGVTYPMNTALAARVLVTGFSDLEHNGTWTDGPAATIWFSLPRTSTKLVMRAVVVPFLNEQHPETVVELSVNGLIRKNEVFRGAMAPRELRIALPPEAIRQGKPLIVSLDIRDPASPEAIGSGHRWLGLFFQEVQIVEASTSK